MPAHRFVAEAVRALPGPAWLADWRIEAFERFDSQPLPTDAEEVWRYSRIGELDLGRYEPPAVARPAPPVPLPETAVALLEAVGDRAGLIVTSGGEVVRVDRSEAAVAAGAVIGGLFGPDSERGDVVPGIVAARHDALGELAAAFLVDAAVVAVPAGVTIEVPVVVVHLVGEAAGGGRPAVFPRTVVSLGDGAVASVIEIMVSAGEAAFVASVTELDVADRARLDFHAVQLLGREVFAIAQQSSRIGRDGRLTSFAAALGGSYARCRTDSRLEGEGGSSHLLAAYFGDGRQTHDFRTLQEHAAPRTRSELLFKGAVGGHARSVYTGLIRIRPGAKGSDAFQTNRNLVLSEGAHADSVPNLDIEENDVRCSHASTVGPIDADQRYYLESRGVPAAVAERLILTGFFADLFERAPAAGLGEELSGRIAHRLATSPDLTGSGDAHPAEKSQEDEGGDE